MGHACLYDTASFMKIVSSVYTLNEHFLTIPTQAAEGNIFRKHTVSKLHRNEKILNSF